MLLLLGRIFGLHRSGIYAIVSEGNQEKKMSTHATVEVHRTFSEVPHLRRLTPLQLEIHLFYKTT